MDDAKNQWQYKVVDKREGSNDKNVNNEEQKESKVENGNKEASGNTTEEPIEIDIVNTLKWMIEILRSQIYIKIGLIAHPQTNLIVQDFPQAKLGIDVLMLIFEKISTFLKSEEKRTIQSIISDLQLNYVNQLKKSGNI